MKPSGDKMMLEHAGAIHGIESENSTMRKRQECLSAPGARVDIMQIREYRPQIYGSLTFNR
jgi:hypothetical protein